MSKSKGNIIDPLVLLDKFGADALRFTMAQLATPGRDVKIGESRVESSRNFITKIWNAARFLEMNECSYDPAFDPMMAKSPVNQWIIQKTAGMIDDVAREIEAYRFDFAAGALYHFLWGAYCDIYVECLKPLLTDSDIANETRKTAMWVLVQFLKAANPIMPMVTEHLWEEFVGTDQPTLMEQPWVTVTAPSSDAIKGVDWAVAFIQEVRSLKGLLGITGVVRVPLISQGSAVDNALLTQHWPWISHLARLSDLKMTGNGVPFVVAGSTFILEINDVIRLDEVKKMLHDKQAVLSIEIGHLSKKLTNEAFKTAKPDLWQTDFDLHSTKLIEVEKIQGILESLDV